MKVALSQQDLRALQALRRSPHARRVREVLERQLAAAREVYERTSPANEGLRMHVLEAKTAYNLLFVDEIALEN